MPKVKPLLASDRDKEEFRTLLEVKRVQAHIKSWAKVAERLGISPDTLYTWLKKPDCISREHLKQLFKLLKFTPADVAMAFGYKEE